MEKSFDFGRILKNHAKIYKSKPSQSVQTRLENSLRHRRSSRLTLIDSKRNISRCVSPVPEPMTEAQKKAEHRKQQLQKWKEEKEKKKKEAASQKKKPFLAGGPLRFVPPPPVPVRPSTSGRVTRSQAARNALANKTSQPTTSRNHSKPSATNIISFAPPNATFKPPLLKHNPKLPYVSIVPLKCTKNKHTVTFNPVQPKNTQDCEANQSKYSVRQTRSRRNQPLEPNVTNKIECRPKAKIAKAVPKISKATSSSSSESDMIKPPVLRHKTHLVTHPSRSSSDSNSMQSPIRKTVSTISNKEKLDSPILVSKTPVKSLKLAKLLTPKNMVPKSESASEEKLRSPKSQLDLPMTPEQIVEEAKRISPCVTLSRGKDKARREMKKKLEEGLLDEDMSEIDNVDHFRRQLASEIKRMTETCETWDRVLEQTILPDSIQECVLTAVGQARLLMSQKLQQFASLVERCARPEPGAALVTPADLHGFWDMVFMQVENVNMRFMKLEEVRARGWTEDAPVVVAKKKVLPKVAKPKPVAGASRIKDMIAAKRKAQKEQAAAAEKTFEGGFFSVSSPVRPHSPRAPCTPLNKPTLLKAVLSNEANKSASKNSASFAMLRASVLGKNMECAGIAPLPQTPLPCPAATPGRSILKQSTVRKSSKKSIKTVLFDQSDTAFNTSLDNQPIAYENPTGLDQSCIEINTTNPPTKDLDNSSPTSHPIEKKHFTSYENQPIAKESGKTTDVKDIDSGLSSMDITGSGKENIQRRSHRLTRQAAVESPRAQDGNTTHQEPSTRSAVQTRSQRRSQPDRLSHPTALNYCT